MNIFLLFFKIIFMIFNLTCYFDVSSHSSKLPRSKCFNGRIWYLRRTVWNSFRERAHLLSFHHDRSNQSYSITQRTGSNFVHLERADFLSACFLSSILRCKCFEALFDWLIHKTLSFHWSTKRCNIKWIASSVHILYFFEYIPVRSSSFYSSLSLPFSGFLPPYYSLSLFCHLLISCLGNHASRIHAAVVARCTYWS